MAIQTPTRITIEIHPAAAADDQATGALPQPIVVVSQHEDQATAPALAPAAYEAGPCLCLDDEDCGQDHGND